METEINVVFSNFANILAMTVYLRQRSILFDFFSPCRSVALYEHAFDLRANKNAPVETNGPRPGYRGRSVAGPCTKAHPARRICELPRQIHRYDKLTGPECGGLQPPANFSVARIIDNTTLEYT